MGYLILYISFLSSCMFLKFVDYSMIKLSKGSHISASEAFFDNLTVEQEFMTGVDTDKVFFIRLPFTIYSKLIHHKSNYKIAVFIEKAFVTVGGFNLD